MKATPSTPRVMSIKEGAMLDGNVHPSEALQQALLVSLRTLMRGLYSCKTCGSVQMIAVPMPGVCTDCGAKLKVLSSETPQAVVPKIEIEE
jgi:hypothetical protein